MGFRGVLTLFALCALLAGAFCFFFFFRFFVFSLSFEKESHYCSPANLSVSNADPQCRRKSRKQSAGADFQDCCQSSICNCSILENSRVLFVTKIKLFDKEIAAIMRSLGPMGLPFEASSARICPYTSEAASSKGRLLKGVKNEIIASMSGHVENSRAFSRYYNIDKEDQEQAIKMIE